jgi:TRAP-type C4-dicarboxylate transport system permease small subunit
LSPEITESTMVLIVFGALAFTQEKRTHIRVEILYAMFGPRVQSFMDMLTHLIALVFFCLLAWYSFGELSYSWEIGESTMGTIRFPLYPARLLLSAGAVLLIVQLALDVISDFGRMRRGEGPPHSAAPADTALAPSMVIPSKNVTVPVAPASSVAVSSTGAPNTDGFGAEVRLAPGAAWLLTGNEVLSPPAAAVTV